MAKNKRLTDCYKWSNSKWFRNLDSGEKLFWFYIHDRCDQAGVWIEDMEETKYHIGTAYDPGTLLNSFKDEILQIPETDKWWLKNYCILQHTSILQEKEKTPPRQCAVRLLKEHDLYDKYVDHFKEAFPALNVDQAWAKVGPKKKNNNTITV